MANALATSRRRPADIYFRQKAVRRGKSMKVIKPGVEIVTLQSPPKIAALADVAIIDEARVGIDVEVVLNVFIHPNGGHAQRVSAMNDEPALLSYKSK